jgi:hypothetical protein
MILHILHEDSKFALKIKKFWENAFPEKNIFVLGSDNAVKNTSGLGFKYVCSANDVFSLIMQNDVSCVIFNGCIKSIYSDIIPEHIKIGWVCWGFEFYGPLHLRLPSLYGPKTKLFFRRELFSAAKSIARSFKNNLNSPAKDLHKFTPRLDFFISQLEEEFVFLKQNAPVKKSLLHLKLPVFMLSDIIDLTNIDWTISRQNIQVGNSATPTNNHADVFEELKNHDLSGRTVYVPLSYGYANYREYVLKIGKKMLGDRFYPLLDFMPLHEYNRTLSSCGYVIMNHFRQQAVGNIIAALTRGSKVFLGPNFIYSTYKSDKLSVFRFPADFNLDEFDSQSLGLKNIAILQKMVGDDAALEMLKSFSALFFR